jgi:serine beta-lactamase-like protein LACTB, mitochondrial
VAKSWNQTETWVAVIALAIGGLLLAIAGMWVYMSATSAPLHPDAASVPSVADADPADTWAGAVERGRQIMRAGLSEQNLPGLSVAVGVDNHVVWAEGFGFADLETREAVTPRHRFRIGTASTVLTSAGLGVLLEQGRLRLDDEVQAHLPEFPKKPWPVTLRHVAAHTAGLVSDSGDEGPLFSQHCERPVEALRHFAHRDLRFEPGTQYRFSNFGWIVVSAAIEAAAGQPFLAFMRDAIFEPAGMLDTRADTIDRVLDDVAAQYFPRFAADTRYGPDPMRDINLSCYAGASVFLSTPSDLVRFGMAINSGKLLQPATVDLLQSSQRLASGDETGYGLGWDLEPVTLLGEPTLAIGHDGEILGGRTTSLFTFHDRGIVVAVLSNTSYADTATLARMTAEAFASHASGAARD